MSERSKDFFMLSFRDARMLFKTSVCVGISSGVSSSRFN